MTDSNRPFFRFPKFTKNGHSASSPNGATPEPSNWPRFLTRLEMQERLVELGTSETALDNRRADVKLKVLRGRLLVLVVLTTVGSEIVVLATHPAFLILNSLALPGLAYQLLKERKEPPDEQGGGP